MSWFEEWFDSPLYEKLYAYRDEEEASLLAVLIEKEIPMSDYRSILDLGCGRGRHSLTLAEKGYRVTGIDLSQNAIEKAGKIAEQRKLTNIDFKVGDMRAPLPETFDAVLNLFTTFGYFLKDKENEKVFESVQSMLKPGGIFFMDYMNAKVVRNNIVPEEKGSYREWDYRISRKIKNDMIYKNIRFFTQSQGQTIKYRERVKLYGLNWFRVVATRNHFTLKKTYGNYEGDPFNEEESSRLIMVFERK
ncbi:MAG: class I SAM-dependent methyltransferase [Balneolaceae bacterium]